MDNTQAQALVEQVRKTVEEFDNSTECSCDPFSEHFVDDGGNCVKYIISRGFSALDQLSAFIQEQEREIEELNSVAHDLNQEINKAYNAGRREQDEIAYREGFRDGQERR